MRPGPSVPIRHLIGPMRNALVIAAVVLAVLGLDLTLFPTHTDKAFSWTIAPPLTAATLGAVYLSAVVLLLLTLHGQVWARARVALGLLGPFQLLSVIRFRGDVSWDEAGAWLYVAFSSVGLIAGVAAVAGIGPGARAALTGRTADVLSDA